MLGTAFCLAVPAVAPIHLTPVALAENPLVPLGSPEFGAATWYGEAFHGLETANGEVFDMFSMTAAHRSFPLGSMVRVTRVDTGRSVVVRVNDRGPAVLNSVIDLSYAAARQLGIAEMGRARVRLERLVQRH